MVGPHLLKGIWANGNHNKAMNVKGYNFLAKLPAIFTFIQLHKVCFFVTVSLLARYPLWIPQRSQVEALVTQIISCLLSWVQCPNHHCQWVVMAIANTNAGQQHSRKQKHRWWGWWWRWWEVLIVSWYKITAVFKDRSKKWFHVKEESVHTVLIGSSHQGDFSC